MKNPEAEKAEKRNKALEALQKAQSQAEAEAIENYWSEDKDTGFEYDDYGGSVDL